jgi:hypothetical protein
VIDERVIRLRCLTDASRECKQHEHYAIDIRLPLTSEALSDALILKCCCGEKLIVLGDEPDPWDRSADAS